MKKSKSTYWLYFLGAYVIVQFLWWGYLLIQLSAYIPNQDASLSKRVGMVIGEGAVFLLILCFGFYKIRKSISKELNFQQQQQNFLLTITHELKTPIAALKLYLQTLQKHNLQADQKLEIIKGALNENNRLSELIENILNAAKAENKEFQIQKQKTELIVFCQKIIQRYNDRFGIKLIDLTGPDSLNFHADQNVLETVILNILENAIKYGGTEQKIEMHIEQLNRFVIIKISDQGPGIEPENRKLIFDKFYRVGSEEIRAQTGSGLGLYIVSEFVKLHNGKVRCLENKPSGSIFEIILPL